MKTTLEIPDGLMRDLKARAARDGKTMSELVEAALRTLLAPGPKETKELPPLPAWDGGGWVVDAGERRLTYELRDAEDPLIQEMKTWSKKER